MTWFTFLSKVAFLNDLTTSWRLPNTFDKFQELKKLNICFLVQQFTFSAVEKLNASLKIEMTIKCHWCLNVLVINYDNNFVDSQQYNCKILSRKIISKDWIFLSSLVARRYLNLTWMFNPTPLLINHNLNHLFFPISQIFNLCLHVHRRWDGIFPVSSRKGHGQSCKCYTTF